MCKVTQYDTVLKQQKIKVTWVVGEAKKVASEFPGMGPGHWFD